MFDPFDRDYLPQNTDYQTENDDHTDPLDTLTRFAAWFTIGITATFLIRLLPSLLPFYWILAIAGMTGLAIALYFTHNVRLLALTALLIAATLAGHWDGLSHQAQQTANQIQEKMQR